MGITMNFKMDIWPPRRRDLQDSYEVRIVFLFGNTPIYSYVNTYDEYPDTHLIDQTVLDAKNDFLERCGAIETTYNKGV